MTASQTTTFGALLRQHRLVASLSQEALAERAGLSVEAISMLERGRRAPRPETVQLLTGALGPEERARLIAAAYPQSAPAMMELRVCESNPRSETVPTHPRGARRACPEGPTVCLRRRERASRPGAACCADLLSPSARCAGPRRPC